MPRVSSPRARANSAAPPRSGRVRRPGARLSTSERRAMTQAAIPKGRFTRNAQRQSPSSHEQAADRRAQAGGQRCRGAPQSDRVGPALGGEGRDDQRQRGRHQHGRAEGLHDAGADEEADRRREGADHRGDREDQDTPDERASPADQVGHPAERDQERREDDVVGVQDPRQVADRGVRERLADAGERDVDDRGVEERQERPERGDPQDCAAGDPAALHGLRGPGIGTHVHAHATPPLSPDVATPTNSREPGPDGVWPGSTARAAGRLLRGRQGPERRQRQQ